MIDGAQIPKMVYQLWNYLADYGGSQIILMSSGFDLFSFYNSGTNQELLSRGFISGDWSAWLAIAIHSIRPALFFFPTIFMSLTTLLSDPGFPGVRSIGPVV